MQVVIKRPITILLLITTTVIIVALTVFVAGKSYGKIDPIPFEDIRHLAHRLPHRPISTQILSVIVLPIVGNVMLFFPWGFFAFIALYRDRKSTRLNFSHIPLSRMP